jgi:hypothetical protein
VDAALENLDLWVKSRQRLILLDLIILKFVERLQLAESLWVISDLQVLRLGVWVL